MNKLFITIIIEYVLFRSKTQVDLFLKIFLHDSQISISEFPPKGLKTIKFHCFRHCAASCADAVSTDREDYFAPLHSATMAMADYCFLEWTR